MLLSTAFIFQSCKKDRIGLEGETSKGKIALFNVATPTRPTSTSPTIDVQGYFFSVDGNRMYTMAMPSGKVSGYFLADPGTRVIKADTSLIIQNIVSPANTVSTTNLTVEADKFYSVYYTGKVQSPDVVVTTDNLTRPSADKIKIRVINLSPDAGLLDIAGRLTSETTPRVPLFTNLTYKTDNPFIEMSPGFYSLELRPSATTTVLNTFTVDNQNPPIFQPSTSSRPNFSMLFEAGKIYTLVIQGYRTPSTAIVGQPANPLAIGAAINLYF